MSHDKFKISGVQGEIMPRKKQNPKDREAMHRTQPKMVRVINGLKGGRGRMVIEEPSAVIKERNANQATPVN